MESRGRFLAGLLVGLVATLAVADDPVPGYTPPTREYVYAGSRLLAVSRLPDAGPPPQITALPARVTEGQSGSSSAAVTLRLAPASPRAVSVYWVTEDGTATAAGGDYVPASGLVTFAPAVTERTISVAALGDSVFEPDETFFVRLSTPSLAMVLTDTSPVTIANDDLPSITLTSSRSASEGPGLGGWEQFPPPPFATFTVTLQGWTGPVSVGYRTLDTSDHPTFATAGVDFVPVSGTLVFERPDELVQQITVFPIDDALAEPAERLVLELHSPVGAVLANTTASVALIDDDPAPTPTPTPGPVRRRLSQ